MTRARAIANAADRRLWLASLVHTAGRCATLAAAGGIAFVLADRLLGLSLPAWALLGAPLALGAAGAIVLASRRRKRMGDASVIVDHALGLRDRVSSALTLNTDDADPFTTLALREGETAATGADVRRAVPLRLDNWWIGAPVAAGALFACVILLPNWDALGRDAQRVAEVAQREDREAAAGTIDDAAQRTREALAEAAVDAATPEQLAALDEIERELAQGRISPDEARAQAASRLDDLAQRLEDRSEREDRAMDALAERFGALDQAAQDSLTRSLEDALRRSDFDDAQRALERLQRELTENPDLGDDASRERLARDLDSISRALQDAARQRDASARRDAPPQPDDPRNPDAFDALREQGLPSDLARELADQTDPRALRDSLEREGLTPEQADRLARQIAEQNTQRNAEDLAAQDAQDLADALQNLSQDIRDDAVPPPPPPPPEPPSPDTPPPQPGDTQPQQQQQPSDRQSDKDPGAQQRDPQEGPSRDVGTDQGDQQQRNTEGGRQQTDAQKPENQQPQPGTQDSPSSRRDDAPSPSNQPAPPDSPPTERDASGSGAGQENETKGADAPGADRDSSRRQDPAAQDSAAREGDQSSRGEGASRSLDKVREMQRRRQDAQNSRESAQRVREQSEQLLESMSPEEREQARRLAELLAQEQGPSRPFDAPAFDDVDARQTPREGDDDAGRVIAEWLSQGRAERDDATGRVTTQRRLTEATRGAQRAIEEQQTPPRFADVIGRYFRRLPDAARQAADGAAPTAPAQSAPDVAPTPGNSP